MKRYLKGDKTNIILRYSAFCHAHIAPPTAPPEDGRGCFPTQRAWRGQSSPLLNYMLAAADYEEFCPSKKAPAVRRSDFPEQAIHDLRAEHRVDSSLPPFYKYRTGVSMISTR